MNLHRKQLILVDHNERQQAVDGLEEADILEIIDHHRIGNLETTGPVYFRNVPVGCTATILYQMFGEQGMTPSKEIAGLLLSAILSDTLMFRSPTSTPQDEAAAKALAALAGEDIPTYAEQMFEAGADLTGRDAEDVFCSDFKVFSRGDAKFGVGQSIYMTDKSRAAAEALVGPFLPEASRGPADDLLHVHRHEDPEHRSDVLRQRCRTDRARGVPCRAEGRQGLAAGGRQP